MINYEKNYLEQKKKTILNLVNQFKEEYGNQAFPWELTKENIKLEKVFCNSKLCSNCGDCCASAPCIFSPSDFLDISDREYMRSILDTGLVCISRSPDDDKTLVLRPRGRQDIRFLYSMTYIRNHCILENGKGCMLPVQYRPLQGLLQIPYDNKGFTSHLVLYPGYQSEQDYKPYQDILKSLIYEYQNRFIPDYEDRLEESVKKLIKSLVKKG